MLLRAGFEPRPESGRAIQIKKLNKTYNILRSKPFYPHSILGFGDFHNVLPPNAPSDHNNQGSTLFPNYLESIPESFPSGQEHIPVAEDNRALAAASKLLRVVGEGGYVSHGGLTLLMQLPPKQFQLPATYDALSIQPQQGEW